ncbi:borealin-2 [Mugil cephalus]|uniref:borealin-2 n=1 Tax=Mugil cephalus TaxID=48193 RepID=UPI001FB608EC|nr:borealin-2 [Mugil cephalus]
MPSRSTRNAGSARNKEQQSQEVRLRRMQLFLQHFDKEVQRRINELEVKLENLLSTVDQAYEVELMKMPLSLRNTLVGDLIQKEKISASEIFKKSESCETASRKPSERGHDSTPVRFMLGQTPSSKTAKGGKGTKTRTLAGSNGTGKLAGSSATAKRTRSHISSTKTSEQTKPKLRSVVSAGDMHCSMARSAAHVTVTTAQGQMVSFSEETKHEINWDLLDDVAWRQIQKLKSLMEHLSQQSSAMSNDA